MEAFENAALFLGLGLPSTLIRRNIVYRKRSFSKTLLKTEEFEDGALRFKVDRKHFENGALRFSVDRKHFENGAFRKR